MLPRLRFRQRLAAGWFVALVAAVLGAGCNRTIGASQAPSEASTAWRDAFQTTLRRHLETLSARPDLASRLDLLRLQPLLDGYYGEGSAVLARERLRTIASVRALAPDEADWQQAILCAGPRSPIADGCDADAALRRLQAREPDNAAVWLMAADVADARADEAGFAAALRRAAQARRYDLHYGSQWSRVREALQGVPLPPLDDETRRYLTEGRIEPATSDDMRATLAGMAVDLPIAQASQRRCREDRTPYRTDCAAVGALMADSDTFIGQMLGLSLMARLTADDAGGPAWRERLRQAHWRNAQARELRHPAQLGAALVRVGEVAAFDTALRAAGRDRAPPDWLPEGENARALVLTGRLPEPAPPP